MKRIILLLVLIVTAVGLSGCSRFDEEGRRILYSGEYEIIVASKMVDTYFGYSFNLTPALTIKKVKEGIWYPIDVAIKGFEWEEGYECRLRILETDYLDYSMGTPAWAEYELVELISKEKKESEGLPEAFAPEEIEDEDL